MIIISIDTLRADRLPLWGYQGVRTPAIDSLAREGVVFRNAWSHAPLTLPSHASMFTGQLPGEHGVRDNLGYRLDAQSATFAEQLSQRGYETAGFVSAWVLRGESGISRGFGLWDDSVEHQPGTAAGELQRAGTATTDAAIRWLDSRSGDRRFLLFVHLFEPHTPYAAPEPFASEYSNAYDAEVAAADAAVGRLLEALRSRGIYDRATIILLSDHGEGLNDHGEAEHGVFLYREVIHVPLVVKLPSQVLAGVQWDGLVQLIDVHPTVLEAAGIRPSAGSMGVSLIATAGGSESGPPRRAFSETMYPRIHYGWSELRSLTDGEVHVIEAPRPELYRMSSDPAERTNRIDSERRLYSSFRQEIESIGAPFSEPSPVSAEEAAKLTALGYLGAGPSTTSGPLPDPKDRMHELRAVNDAWHAFREGRIAESIRLYESVLESNPRLADAWLQLSAARERAGNLEGAVTAAQHAIETAPSLAHGVALTIARLQLQLGNLEAAAKHAELGKAANSAEADLLLARVALAQRDYERAERLGWALMEMEPMRGAASVVLAQAMVARQDLAGALELLERERSVLLSAGRPLPSQMEFARADALVRLGRVDEAIAAFQSEIRHHPGNLQAYASLAVVLLLAGRDHEALGVMEQMVASNPDPRSRALAEDTFERTGRSDLADRWRSHSVPPAPLTASQTPK